MSFKLGIDIGTSGVRSAVLGHDNIVISMARAEHKPQDPQNINAELWWHSVKECIHKQVQQLLLEGHNPKNIMRIAVDGTSGSMVLTDDELIPLSRALMYNSNGFDLEAEKIKSIAPANHIVQGSNSALARAMKLVSEAPRAKHLLHQADFITAKLLGFASFSDHNNALKTGFDPEFDQWPDWINALIPQNILPQVRPVGTPLNRLHIDIAKELGLSPNAMIFAGTTDSTAAFFAAAPIEENIAVTSLGSTLAVKVFGSKRLEDPAIGLYSHRVGDNWLAGGASNTGGAVLAHYFTPDELQELSRHINPTITTGYDYYPLLKAGERFPFNDPNLQPKLSPRPNEDYVFLQAIFEGIAKIEAQCYRHIARAGGTYPTAIYSAGGGANNPVLTKIRANALGITPIQSPLSEAAIGTAKLTMLHTKTI